MPADPEQSGVFTPGKIFEGKFCTQIPVEEARKGDYIEFNRQGRRVRKVKDVVRTKKHVYIQIEQSKYNPFKNQKVDARDVVSAWRPQRKLRRPELLQRPNYELEIPHDG